MKCDLCEYLCCARATPNHPYEFFWCCAGQWEGGPRPEEGAYDPWKDCPDFIPENIENKI